jgi:hypothetical protein
VPCLPKKAIASIFECLTSLHFFKGAYKLGSLLAKNGVFGLALSSVSPKTLSRYKKQLVAVNLRKEDF